MTPSWAGADNFNTLVTQITYNFDNTLADLTTRFSSAEYQSVIASTSGSVYEQAVSGYTCPTTLTSTTVNCPFANFFECFGSSQTQTPIFSSEFCNTTYTNSAANLVLAEQTQNSTLWHDSLVNQSTEILDFSGNPANFTTLISESQQLQDAITEYKPQLSDSINSVLFCLFRPTTTSITAKSGPIPSFPSSY